MQGIQGITGIRGIGYRRRRGGGSLWPSAPVAGLHVYSEAGPAWCRQFADGTGEVVADDPVGYMHNAGALETPFTQATTGARPLMAWDEEKEAWYLQFDRVDDWMRLTLPTWSSPWEVWLMVATASTNNQQPILGVHPRDGYQGLMVSADSGFVVSWRDHTTREAEYRANISAVGTRDRCVLRGISTVESQELYINNLASPASPPLLGAPPSKTDLLLNYLIGNTPYGDSQIYAIAATIGSVMSTAQVNALKADWSAKFGVEFAW